MDPYSPPAQLWDMPKQGKLFSPLTLTGNWYERRELSADIVDFEKENARAKVVDAKRAWMFHESKRPMVEIGHRDNGGLYVEDAIHLRCIGMDVPGEKSKNFVQPALVLDMSEAAQINGIAHAFASSTDTEPKGRSTFILKSEDEKTYHPQTKRIKYGDPVYLRSVIEWEGGLEWRLTSSTDHAYDIDLDKRKQTAWLFPFATKRSLWLLQCVDRSMRPIMEGEFVDTRQPIVLTHVMTGKSLTVCLQKLFKTSYGNEHLMTCDTYYSRGRQETNNARFMIHLISFAPWKLDNQKEDEFRSKLEDQIDECSQNELARNPPHNQNMTNHKIGKETVAPTFDGWYDHGNYNPVGEACGFTPAEQPIRHETVPPYIHSRFKQKHLLSSREKTN